MLRNNHSHKGQVKVLLDHQVDNEPDVVGPRKERTSDDERANVTIVVCRKLGTVDRWQAAGTAHPQLETRDTPGMSGQGVS